MAEIKLANGQEVKELRVFDGVKWIAKRGRIFDGVKWIDFIRPPLSFKDDMEVTSGMMRQLPKTIVRGIVEGLNLFSKSKVVDLAVKGNVASGNIISRSDYRGYYIPVKEGEKYSVSRNSLSNNRFDYGFTVEEPEVGVAISGGSTSYRDSLEINDIVVPSGYNYMFLYLSNQGDEIPNIKLIKETDKLQGDVILVQNSSLFNIGDEVTITDGINNEDIVIVGRNVLQNSNDFSRQTTYQGSTYSYTEGVYVEEWGTNNATRIITSGGSHKLKLTPTISYKTSVLVTYSVWVKNNGDKRLTMKFNGLTGAPTITFEPKEQKRVIVTGTMRDNYTWFQRQFWTLDVNDNVDVILWREKLEEGDKGTIWTLAPEDIYGTSDNVLSVTPVTNWYKKNSIIARTNAEVRDDKLSYLTYKTYSVK